MGMNFFLYEIILLVWYFLIFKNVLFCKKVGILKREIDRIIILGDLSIFFLIIGEIEIYLGYVYIISVCIWFKRLINNLVNMYLVIVDFMFILCVYGIFFKIVYRISFNVF